MAKVEYFGKYRAKVQNVNDPEKRGRIRVLCPKVLGNSVSNWCEPCVPVAYNFGGDFAVPKVGETVWIEFEAGDVNKPVYTGGWWAKNGAPLSPYNTNTRCIEWNGCMIVMSEGNSDISAPSSVNIYVGGNRITISSNGVDIVANNISLWGNVLANGEPVKTGNDTKEE